MRKCFLLLFMVFIITGSCENSGEDDLSLSIEEYKQLGMPDPSGIWGQGDYRQAYTVLAQLKTNRELSLPRKGSNKSGQYFKRLTSLENISFLKDDSMPLKEKALQIQTYIIIQSDLTDLYTDLYSESQYYHRELIELFLFGLSITEEMLELAFKISESDDENDMILRSGIPSIRYTYLTMLSFILDNQNNSSVYLTEDLERLTDSLSVSVLKNKEWMDASARKSLKNQIQRVINNTSSEYISNKYNRLIEAL